MMASTLRWLGTIVSKYSTKIWQDSFLPCSMLKRLEFWSVKIKEIPQWSFNSVLVNTCTYAEFWQQILIENVNK